MRPRKCSPRRSALRHLASAVACGLVLVPAGIGLAARPASAASSDPPKDFWVGTDSYAPIPGGSYPYKEPSVPGLYAAYTAEIGTWTNWLGCTHGEGESVTAINEVNADEAVNPAIPGVSFYWFAAGPGADPHYNGTYAEAYKWGKEQAEHVAFDYGQLLKEGIRTDTAYIPFVFMDIEGQPVAGYANGWNEIVNHCARITKRKVIPVEIDRATFNGFYDFIHLHTIFHPGVYSTPDFWKFTFGTGPEGHIPNTYEWTPVVSAPHPRPKPDQFTNGRDSAVWFGGVTTGKQAGWQWTQAGGDYDEWDDAHLP